MFQGEFLIYYLTKKFIHREEFEYVSQNDKLGYLIIKVKDCHKRKFEILAHFSLYYGFDIWPLKCIMLNLKLPVDGKISNNEIHFKKKPTKTFINESNTNIHQ